MKNKLARFAALALTPVLLFGAPMLARAATPTVIEVATVITPEAAVAAARLALNTDSAVSRIQLETEHGAQVYDIRFANGMRARVDASTSDVIRTRAEHRRDRDVDQHEDRHGDDRRATPAVPATPARSGQPAIPATRATPATPATHMETETHGNPAEVSHGGTHVETEVHGNPTEVVHGGGNSGGNSGGNGGGNSGRGNGGGGNSGRR